MLSRNGIGAGAEGQVGRGAGGGRCWQARCWQVRCWQAVRRTVLAGTVLIGTVSAGTGSGSTALIPDVTDATRPSAAAAMNTMTTPSAVKKPSCSMVRMYTVALAGEPPMGTWLFHSGLSTGPSVNQAPAAAASSAPNSATCLPGGDHEEEAAEEYRRTGQDLQPQPGRVIGPGRIRRVSEVEIRSDEGDERAPQTEQDQQESAESSSTAPHLQHPSHGYHFPGESFFLLCGP